MDVLWFHNEKTVARMREIGFEGFGRTRKS